MSGNRYALQIVFYLLKCNIDRQARDKRRSGGGLLSFFLVFLFTYMYIESIISKLPFYGTMQINNCIGITKINIEMEV